MKLKILSVALLAVVAVGGYAVGQSESLTEDAFKSGVAGYLITGDRLGFALTATGVKRITEDKERAGSVISMGLFYKEKGLPLLMAAQVAQNQKLIEQNARIIELLEAQAKK